MDGGGLGSCQRPGEGPQEGTHRAARAAREESRRVALAALARRTPHPPLCRRLKTTSRHSPPHGATDARAAARRQPCAIPSVMPFKNRNA